MSIRWKLLIPITIIIVLATAILGGYSFLTTKTILTKDMVNQGNSKVDDLVNQVNRGLSAQKIASDRFDRFGLDLAHAAAEIVARDPGIKTTAGLTKLAKTLGVEEIHIADIKGILRWGNIPAFIGYDFGSSEQSKIFLQALKNPSFELAQEPTPRGADKKLFQYIGVATVGQPGVIQIGYSPEARQKLQEANDIRTMAVDVKFGKTGYAFVVGPDGKTVAHPDKARVGEDLKQYDWGRKFLEKGNGDLFYTFKGQAKYMAFRRVGDMTLAVVAPQSDFYGPLVNLGFQIILVFLLSVAAAVVVSGYLVNGTVVKPIAKLESLLHAAGQGDLNVKADVRGNDEVARLGNSFNQMVANTRAVVSKVSGISADVAASSEQLASSARSVGDVTQQVTMTISQLAEGSDEQARSAADAGQAVDSMSASIQQVASASDKMAADAKAAAETAGQGQESVTKAVRQMQAIKVAEDATSQAIQGLGQRSQQIGQIVEVITGIADQTNLLALNAAIEAARAGEQGRGFAVVADEVRKLAEQSREAAEQISGLIREIQGETAKAVTTMDSAGKEVEAGTKVVTETGEAFKSVVNAIQTVVAQIKQVGDATQSLAAASQQAVHSVESIAATTQESAAGAEEVSASAQEQSASVQEIASNAEALSGMAQELKKAVASFKL